MDLTALMGGGNPPDKAEQPKIEYTAQVASPLVSGEVKLTIDENVFTVAALFDAVEIPFAEVNAIAFADYLVTVNADSGDYTFSRMGQWAERFYDALVDAYNKAVLRSLFVSGKPLVTAKGDYSLSEHAPARHSYSEHAPTRHSELDSESKSTRSEIAGPRIKFGAGPAAEGGTRNDKAEAFVRPDTPLQVFENAVVALPPDLSARRVPLCFVNGMQKGEYALTLKLNTGESYTFSKLGYDTAPVETAVEKQIRALREKALAAVKEIDPGLTAAQASQLAKLLPDGAAAAFEQIVAIAPSFVAALENKLAETRAADSYKEFKTLCDLASIYIGFQKNETIGSADGGLPDIDGGLGAMLGGLTGGGIGGMLGGLVAASNSLDTLGDLTGGESAATTTDEGESEPPPPYLFWLIAPSPDEQFAAVEFAAVNSATFVYRTGGDFSRFAKQLNRALEAINFKREVIRMTDEELQKPENADYYMAAKRTAALQFVRANFVGRVIHSNADSWKRKLVEIWDGKAHDRI